MAKTPPSSSSSLALVPTPDLSRLLWPHVTTSLADMRAVFTLAAGAEEEVVPEELLPPHARWQGSVAVGDESLAEVGQAAIGCYCQLAPGKGNTGGRLARMVQNAEEKAALEIFRKKNKDKY